MVDWDRVEELRSKGWDWERIADDPKVGFHPDASVTNTGRALRALYHRQRSRRERQGAPTPTPRKIAEAEKTSKWTLLRVGYLIVPIVGVWFLFAYLLPSPVGVIVAAIPYLALAFAVAAFILLFALWRTSGDRWSKMLRNTLIVGVVVGLVFSGLVALGGALFFGCPILPPQSSGVTQPGGLGWSYYSASAWQDSGRPVVYFYGASWCPYCSASSWAIWKALTEFGTVSGNSPSYSSSSDVYPGTPEMVLAGASISSNTVSFQVSEDTSGVDGTFPGTSNCVQQAYVSAYSSGSIPFVVVNGQYVHGGSTLIDPANLQNWSEGSNPNGATVVEESVHAESGEPWNVVSSQVYFIMACMTKASGQSVSSLASEYHWSAAVQAGVTNDLNGLS